MTGNNGFEKRINQSQADVRKMLAEWRSHNSNEVELPLSHRMLSVRDVGAIDLAIEGKIPNTLMDLVQQMTDGKISESELMKNHSAEFGNLLDLVFVNAVVFPPVADEPDDEHISPKEFVYGDKLALFNWVNREAQSVRPFRPANGELMAGAPNGKSYGKRPSDLLGLETDWGAWQFDELCALVGNWVEGNLMNGKNPFEALTPALSQNGRGGKFRNPKSLVRRKVKIPENGIW